jgi:hypothetical protein
MQTKISVTIFPLKKSIKEKTKKCVDQVNQNQKTSKTPQRSLRTKTNKLQSTKLPKTQISVKLPYKKKAAPQIQKNQAIEQNHVKPAEQAKKAQKIEKKKLPKKEFTDNLDPFIRKFKDSPKNQLLEMSKKLLTKNFSLLNS